MRSLVGDPDLGVGVAVGDGDGDRALAVGHGVADEHVHHLQQRAHGHAHGHDPVALRHDRPADGPPTPAAHGVADQRGASVIVEAAPDEGATFSHWEGACSDEDRSCTLSLDGNRSVVAVFASVFAIVDSPLAPAVMGAEYVATLRVTGAPGAVAWSISEGTLPPGLSLDPDAGAIRGIPTDAPRAQSALLIGAAQILWMDVPDHAAVDLSVRLVQPDRRDAGYAGLVNAVLRRAAPEGGGDVLSFGGLVLNTSSHRVTANDRNLELGPTEFRLLRFFMSHPERVFSRSQLLDRVWGGNVYVEERTVDVHIRRLRKALNDVKGTRDVIRTVRAAGYALDVEVA